MSWVTDAGKEISKGVQAGVNSLRAPDYIYWWVVPFMVALVISVLITIFILRGVSGSLKQTCLNFVKEEDEGKTDNCDSVGLPLWVSVVSIIVAPTIIALSVAAGVYKVGVYTHNPKMAAGIMTTSYVADAFD
jgi:amino acid transporter